MNCCSFWDGFFHYFQQPINADIFGPACITWNFAVFEMSFFVIFKPFIWNSVWKFFYRILSMSGRVWTRFINLALQLVPRPRNQPKVFSTHIPTKFSLPCFWKAWNCHIRTFEKLNRNRNFYKKWRMTLSKWHMIKVLCHSSIE